MTSFFLLRRYLLFFPFSQPLPLTWPTPPPPPPPSFSGTSLSAPSLPFAVGVRCKSPFPLYCGPSILGTYTRRPFDFLLFQSSDDLVPFHILFRGRGYSAFSPPYLRFFLVFIGHLFSPFPPFIVLSYRNSPFLFYWLPPSDQFIRLPAIHCTPFYPRESGPLFFPDIGGTVFLPWWQYRIAPSFPLAVPTPLPTELHSGPSLPSLVSDRSFFPYFASFVFPLPISTTFTALSFPFDSYRSFFSNSSGHCSRFFLFIRFFEASGPVNPSPLLHA